MVTAPVDSLDTKVDGAAASLGFSGPAAALQLWSMTGRAMFDGLNQLQALTFPGVKTAER
jgi:hypothetical protein